MARFFRSAAKWLAISFFSGAVLVVHAVPPQTINYQGYLTNGSGQAVNTATSMAFRIYDVPTGGTALFTETQMVTPVNGVFNVVLGSTAPLILQFDVPYYLGITSGADAEMTPRQALTSTPYAFRATFANSVAASATISASQIAGAVSNAVTASALSGPVSGSQITGPIVAATISGSQITGSLSTTANLVLGNSTSTSGNIIKGIAPFLHDFGSNNTFVGASAGNFTMSGGSNTGAGASSLSSVTSGSSNTAGGTFALSSNTAGSLNTALGSLALFSNSTGGGNSAVGGNALFNNSTGSNNTAFGQGAMAGNSSGNDNIALGTNAGSSLTNGSNNIAIGNSGVGGESDTIRIGAGQTSAYIAGINGATSSAGVAVFVNASGQLGTLTSSGRFKQDVADMGDATSVLMKLRPVTFHYKPSHDDGSQLLQYGLVAEEVDKVIPGLVVHAPDAQAQTVRYHFLTPMLLNEYQKQQRTIESQKATIDQQAKLLLAMKDELSVIKKALGIK